MAPRFQTFDETEPHDLADRLRRRCYRQTEATITLCKRPVALEQDDIAFAQLSCSKYLFDRVIQTSGDSASGHHALAPSDVEMRDHAWGAWRAVYLSQITESRREINNRILDRIPQPAAFFAARLDMGLAATGLCVIDAGCAVVECVATEASARRRGAARCVMQALETWAAGQGCDVLCLQVVESNAPAVALYTGLGFRPAARNCFWMPDGP